MSDDAEECPECPAGAPPWVMTFADLMSLLMCFFVLLLAFSEMDVLKYKQVAGSMREAFGVQNEIKKKDIPRGTSVIAQEFTPGRPDPTPLNEVRQKTTDMTRSTLDVICERNSENPQEDTTEMGSGNDSGRVIVIEKLEELIRKTQSDAMNVAESLESEIRNGQVEVETKGREIIIRVREHGSFPSGSATLQSSFIPIMTKIRGVLSLTPGKISVEGHSDNVPIRTERFRSNWDLSSARAVSVAHELLLDETLSPERFAVSGYADTRPLVPNDTESNMAINRRVEIVVSQADIINKARQAVDKQAEAELQDDVQDLLGGTANVKTREEEMQRTLPEVEFSPIKRSAMEAEMQVVAPQPTKEELRRMELMKERALIENAEDFGTQGSAPASGSAVQADGATNSSAGSKPAPPESSTNSTLPNSANSESSSPQSSSVEETFGAGSDEIF